MTALLIAGIFRAAPKGCQAGASAGGGVGALGEEFGGGGSKDCCRRSGLGVYVGAPVTLAYLDTQFSQYSSNGRSNRHCPTAQPADGRASELHNLPAVTVVG